jgi:hypothetical protein
MSSSNASEASRTGSVGSTNLLGSFGSTNSSTDSPEVAVLDDSSVTAVESSSVIDAGDGPVATAIMDDVDLEEGTIKGVTWKKIYLKDLRKFCYKNDVRLDDGTSVRKTPKNTLTALIREKKIRIGNGQEDPWMLLERAKKSNKKLAPVIMGVNRYRLANVIFGDACRNCLENLGHTLNKDELTAGLKSDQTVYEAVALQYNDKDEYNDLQYTGISIPGGTDPSIFQAISWDEAKRVTNECLRTLEKAMRQMTVSGSHGSDIEEGTAPTVSGSHGSDIEEGTAPLPGLQSKFPYVFYWFEFQKEHSLFFRNMTTNLPEDVFRETGKRGGTNFVKNNNNKKKKDEVAVALNTMNDLEEKKLSLEMKRFEALERKVGLDEKKVGAIIDANLVHKETAIVNQIQALQSTKRGLASEKLELQKELVEECDGDRKQTKHRQKAHRERKKTRGGGKDPDTPESNASMMDAIDDIEERCTIVDDSMARKMKNISQS